MSTAWKTRAGSAPPRTLIRSEAARSADAGPVEDGEERLEVLGPGAVEGDVAAGDGRRDGERPGLDAIGHDPVVGAAEALAALDLDRVGVRP